MKKVLVIEDDETIQHVLHAFLGQKGFEVTLAQNGALGLDLLREEKFNLILTDLMMPGIGGIEVLKEVVASKIGVPVVIMTAFGTLQTAVEAMRIGAFDYITKPFNLDELMIVLEKAISFAKLQKENTMLKMQLENLGERLAILVSNKVVTAADLPGKFFPSAFADRERAGGTFKQQDQAAPTSRPAKLKHGALEVGDGGIDLNQMVSNLERNLIMQALKKAKGVRSRAAQLLKLNRTTLLEKMKKMRIDTQKT